MRKEEQELRFEYHVFLKTQAQTLSLSSLAHSKFMNILIDLET
jgi:hypothetical protein